MAGSTAFSPEHTEISPSPQRLNKTFLTAFTGMDPTPPIPTFIRSSTSVPVDISEVQRERCINTSNLLSAMTELHPVFQESVRSGRERSRKAAFRGELPNLAEGDFVLMAREDFTAGEKLFLRWHGPRRVVKAINVYVNQVKDLRTRLVSDVHISRLKFYHGPSSDMEAIISHVVSSEAGMPVHRLVRLL